MAPLAAAALGSVCGSGVAATAPFHLCELNESHGWVRAGARVARIPGGAARAAEGRHLPVVRVASYANVAARSEASDDRR